MKTKDNKKKITVRENTISTSPYFHKMQSVTIEEPPSPLANWRSSSYLKLTLIVLGGVVFAVLLPVIIVILSNSGKSIRTVSILDERIDCMPWLKSKKISVNDCSLLPHCVFEPVDDNMKVPSCYMHRYSFRSSVITLENNTQVASYLINTTYGNYKAQNNGNNANDTAGFFQFKLEFSFLSDAVLSFKVYILYVWCFCSLFFNISQIC